MIVYFFMLSQLFAVNSRAYQNVLSKRRFTGSIEVNHKEQTMEISVVPRDNHIEDAVTNTRALSGGERSYTTVAFLISLWACVDHPFFFLDEYDVFAVSFTKSFYFYLHFLFINFFNFFSSTG